MFYWSLISLMTKNDVWTMRLHLFRCYLKNHMHWTSVLQMYLWYKNKSSFLLHLIMHLISKTFLSFLKWRKNMPHDCVNPNESPVTVCIVIICQVIRANALWCHLGFLIIQNDICSNNVYDQYWRITRWL